MTAAHPLFVVDHCRVDGTVNDAQSKRIALCLVFVFQILSLLLQLLWGGRREGEGVRGKGLWSRKDEMIEAIS